MLRTPARVFTSEGLTPELASLTRPPPRRPMVFRSPRRKGHHRQAPRGCKRQRASDLLCDQSLGRRGRGLWKRDHIGWNRHPRSLRLDPDVTLYWGPLGVIERCHCDRSKTRSYLHSMCDRRSALGAKLHLEPSATLVGVMLIRRELPLQDFHIAIIEVGDRRERAAQSSLTERAMTDLADLRSSLHSIPNGAARATTFVDLGHWLG